ncbi:hypothetical protein HanHA300_Chr16g0608651 [Helianthus annuus]|nr:hypothetical protein HanHA300_Chr16g0608651 [Helianthus annuus]KAJ0460310.1 hypothetical protein HanHA89_Chr16g0659291 [Helianthus annuus]KAJ0640753.1 hypothetical protein HanLR1_Chr16g0619281 [Helianthus annuus]
MCHQCERQRGGLLGDITRSLDAKKSMGDITGSLDAKKALTGALKIHKKYLKKAEYYIFNNCSFIHVRGGKMGWLGRWIFCGPKQAWLR